MIKEVGQSSHARGGGGTSAAVDFDTAIAGLSFKDRGSIDRQLVARENAPVFGLAHRWRHLVAHLLGLAPGLIKLVGVHTMQFYVPDGKYRKQVFALHATPLGEMFVCTPDIVDDAIAAGLLQSPPFPDRPDDYGLPGSSQTLPIRFVDGKTLDPQMYYKDMTGWNRRALCIIVPTDATHMQMTAIDDLCRLAAVGWASQVNSTPG